MTFSFSVLAENVRRQFSVVPSDFKTEIVHLSEDEMGYVWISTDEGLVRYDGNHFDRFTHNPNDSLSLPANLCFETLIDSKSRFWVATNAGLSLFNRLDLSFHTVQVDTFAPAVIDIEEDFSDHSIWLLGYDAVYRYYPETGHVDVNPGRWGRRFILTDKNIIVVSESEGLFCFSKKDFFHARYEERFHYVPELLSDKISTHLFRILEASDHTFFVGSLNDGVYLLNPDFSLREHYNAGDNPHCISSNTICTFSEDDNRLVWIGTINGNISVYDLDNKRFAEKNLIFPDEVNAQNLTTSAILFDKQGNLWVGSYRNWLMQSSVSDAVFAYHKLPVGLPVSSLAKGLNGEVLIGTDGAGVFSYTEQGGLIPSAFSTLFPAASTHISALRNFDNSIFAVAWGKGVGCSKKGVSPDYEKIPFKYSKIQDVLKVDSGLWVAADGYGLAFLGNDGQFRSFENSSSPVFCRDMPHYPRFLHRDSKNRIWACTSYGLCCWNGKDYINYLPAEGNNNDIIMLQEGDDGTIWFLSKNDGLCSVNPATAVIYFWSKYFDLPRGLRSFTVDKNNKIWVCNSDHIFSIDTEKKVVRDFNVSKFLGADVFHDRAVLLEDNGKLWFGTTSGFFTVQTNLVSDPVKSQVILTSFSLFGKLQSPESSDVLDEDISFAQQITLNPSHSFFGFGFGCPNYAAADQLTYYYRLSGLSDQWVRADIPSVSFSGLSSGSYELDVKVHAGKICVGHLSHPLSIVITPPWWKSWWFILSLVLFGAIVVSSIFYFRIRFLNEQKKQLAVEVEKRTRELAESNDAIMRHNAQIAQKNEELDAALSTKDKIISVIAHDLRNPMTVISGMLDCLSSSPELKDSTNVMEQLRTASNAASNLQSQMENLLHWSRLQSSSIACSPTDVFFFVPVKGCISLLQDVARRKSLVISFEDKSTVSGYADERMLATIVRNLIANAIKFSYPKGRIDLNAKDFNGGVMLSVTDYGIGMSSETVDAIMQNSAFKKSAQGTSGEIGSGLGLSICMDFAKRCGGEISVVSEQGKGSTFSLWLPAGNVPRQNAESSLLFSSDDVNHETELTEDASKVEEEVTFVNEDEKKTILIVDDDAELLSYLSFVFQSDYVVVAANDGEQGLNMARQVIPDLIITDLMMPNMNGKQLCEAIKTDILTQHIPVLMLTASDSEVSQIESLNLGADDYMIKPFHRDIVLAKVHSVLKNKERQLHHYRNQILSMTQEELPDSEKDSFMAKATEIVKKHVADSDFNSDEFASELAISRVQLFRKFKSFMGTTPSDFVKQYRLVYASQLLTSGGMNVTDTAFACGFNDAKYFSQCFVAKFGVKPSNYMKKSK